MERKVMEELTPIITYGSKKYVHFYVFDHMIVISSSPCQFEPYLNSVLTQAKCSFSAVDTINNRRNVTVTGKRSV